MKKVTRRKFFASTGAAALTIGTTSQAVTLDGDLRYDRDASNMDFEIKRTDEDWREILSDYEYAILREGRTETRFIGDLWKETAEGTYHCKGCDLPIYSSIQKVILNIGWVFFYHSEPDSVLLAIEGSTPSEFGEMGASSAGITEVHCRRCSSHLGHYLIIEDAMTHCINDTALKFKPVSA